MARQKELTENLEMALLEGSKTLIDETLQPGEARTDFIRKAISQAIDERSGQEYPKIIKTVRVNLILNSNLVERIDAALDAGEGRQDFIRSAINDKLLNREVGFNHSNQLDEDNQVIEGRERTHVILPKGTKEKIDILLLDGETRISFLRKAIKSELIRRMRKNT
ncbi:hypothetical protein [Methylobacterium sp.]|uniref:hypothetical protein n=1 Tax=Methylobacterium sp. TaxID=409 RepID=UPI003C7450C1